MLEVCAVDVRALRGLEGIDEEVIVGKVSIISPAFGEGVFAIAIEAAIKQSADDVHDRCTAGIARKP